MYLNENYVQFGFADLEINILVREISFVFSQII